MAVAPKVQASNGYINGHVNGIRERDSSDSEYDEDTPGHQEESFDVVSVLALACDDGCVRLYNVTDTDKLVYKRTLPRVSGEISSP